ncbi:MAG: T9SS type A sorting domain-containing protein [Bacteroidetes bacterium]|nr:T9SS type A sorting domain-containing protein [Bacteroidota bacterium]
MRYAIIILLLVFSQATYCQTTNTPSPAIGKNNAFRAYNPITGISSYGHNGTNLLAGMDEWGGVYRCAATFGPTAAGVPAYAVITQATLSFSLTVPGQTTMLVIIDSAGHPIDTVKYTQKYSGTPLKITSPSRLIKDVSRYNNQPLWDAIGWGGTFATGITTSSTKVAFSRQSTSAPQRAFLDSLTNCVKSQRVFNLGFMSEYEGTPLGQDIIGNPSMDVTWRNPMITFKNSFNTGNMLIDGTYYAAGVQRLWIPTEIHSVTAVDGQIVNEHARVFRYWNTPTGPLYSKTISVSSVPNSDVTYTAVFDSMFKVTVQNDFDGRGNGGTILWNKGIQSSPYTTWLLSGQSATIGAKSPQTNPGDGLEYGFLNWLDDKNQPISRRIVPSANLSYTAKFQPRVALSLPTLSFLEPGSGGYYKVDGVQTNSVVITAGTQHTIQAFPPDNAKWVFTKWSDGYILNPRTITPSTSMTLYAVFKGLHLSSDASAFGNNGERKFARTPDNWYHMVYSSGGHVWYETSKDQGKTWTLMNRNQPLDNGGGKLPSIDCSPNHSTYPAVVIAFQEGSNIHVRVYYYDGYSYVNGPQELIPSGESAGASITPNIAWCRDWTFMVVWKRSSGIAYMLGIEAGLGCTGHATASQGMIAGTNSYSSNPAISTDVQDKYPYFDVAWEQLTPILSGPPLISILTCTLINSGGYNCVSGYWGPVRQYPQATPPYKTVSSSSMKWNSHPSIISMPGDSWICWVADYTGMGSDPTQVKTQLRRPWTSSGFYTYGFCCKSTTINKLDDNTAFYFAFSEVIPPPIVPSTVTTDYAISSKNLSYYGALNTHTVDLQLCNGTSKSNMYASAYYSSASPRYFQTSNSMSSVGLAKTDPGLISISRGVAVENKGAGICYSFGNITLDGKPIGFVQTEDAGRHIDRDSVNVMDRMKDESGAIGITVDSVNNVLMSEPFKMKSDSKLIFSDYAVIGDSSAAVVLLGHKGFVSFKVDLVDASTGRLIGTMKQVTFDRSGLRTHKRSFYKLKSGGVKEKTVKVKVTLTTNIESPQLSLMDEYTDADERGTDNSAVQSLSLQEAELITDYALGQNYPNPFNPTTVISYTIPRDGMVSLKIFDVLGREVRTLVRENQAVGKYSVTFDGAGLASGIYFYQLRSGDFVSIKKMLLVK